MDPQLVKYQYSGVRFDWVMFANDAGGPDRFFFQTAIQSGFGWKSTGWLAVRNDASAFTAAGSPPATDAAISLSATALL
jgi:hypothetical protein